MRNRILMLILCTLTVLPCFSKGKKEELKPPLMEVLPMGTPRDVEGLAISNERLSVQGDRRDIAFSLDPDWSLKKLEKAETYTHAFIERPDGPIDTMELMKGDDLICWVGDGIRADMGPAGLKVFPDEGVDRIKLKTNGKSWSVSLKKETPIIWNDEEYVVFVSKIKKGTMQDQPEFAVDLVIMRK